MEDTVCALYCDYVSFFLRGKTKSVFPSDVATSWLAPRAASCTSLFCTHTAYQSSHQQSTATSVVTRKSRLVQKHNAELMIHETNVFKIFFFFSTNDKHEKFAQRWENRCPPKVTQITLLPWEYDYGMYLNFSMKSATKQMLLCCNVIKVSIKDLCQRSFLFWLEIGGNLNDSLRGKRNKKCDLTLHKCVDSESRCGDRLVDFFFFFFSSTVFGNYSSVEAGKPHRWPIRWKNTPACRHSYSHTAHPAGAPMQIFTSNWSYRLLSASFLSLVSHAIK